MAGHFRGGSGRLRHRLQLQSFAASSLPDGTRRKSWATEIVLWANVEPLREDERVQGSRVEGVRTHRVRLRARHNPITSDQRFVWNYRGRNRILMIDGAYDRFEHNAEAVVLCVEVDGDGERF